MATESEIDNCVIISSFRNPEIRAGILFPAAERAGLLVKSIESLPAIASIEAIMHNISDCKYAIVDLSNLTSNAAIEFGMRLAFAYGSTLILKDEARADQIPSNVAGQLFLTYDSNRSHESVDRIAFALVQMRRREALVNPKPRDADIFISYKREEREQIQRLASAFHGRGISVWWDSQINPSPVPWAQQLSEAMACSKAIVVCWSKLAIESEWVHREASFACDNDKIVQISLDGIAPPQRFQKYQCADFSGVSRFGEAAQFPRLIETVKEMVKDKIL